MTLEDFEYRDEFMSALSGFVSFARELPAERLPMVVDGMARLMGSYAEMNGASESAAQTLNKSNVVNMH